MNSTYREISAGEQTLAVSTTGRYAMTWRDDGSKAKQDCAMWRPDPEEKDFFILGFYAQADFNEASGSSIIVKAKNDKASSPLLTPPRDWHQVWSGEGMHNNRSGSFWSPVPHDGYIGLGWVGTWGYEKPDIPNLVCIRKDLVEPTRVGNQIWNDKGSGAHQDVTLYSIEGLPNAFVGQGNYLPFAGTAVYKVKGW